MFLSKIPCTYRAVRSINVFRVLFDKATCIFTRYSLGVPVLGREGFFCLAAHYEKRLGENSMSRILLCLTGYPEHRMLVPGWRFDSIARMRLTH